MTGRTRIIAAEGAFHGRTMGALALTAKPKYREPFAPLPGGVELVPFGDADALRRRGGRRRAPPWSWSRSRARPASRPARPATSRAPGRSATPAGALLVARRGADRHGPHRQVARPRGRRGRCPTSSPLAKGLGGGFPIGACVAFGRRRARCSARAARHHLRRQPGGGRAGAGGARVIERDGLLDRRPSDGRAPAPTASSASATRWSPGSAARACCSASTLDRRRRRRRRRRGAGRRLHRQRPRPGRAPAGAAADPHRRAAGQLRRRAARPARRRPRSGIDDRPPLPARRRPHPAEQAAGAGPRRRAQGRPVHVQPARRAAQPSP